MNINIVAFVSIKPGSEEAFLEAASTCVAASRNEPGVLRYDLWREQEGDRRFVFNELYVDEAAVSAHMESAHFKALGAAARDLASDRPVLVKSTPVDVG